MLLVESCVNTICLLHALEQQSVYFVICCQVLYVKPFKIMKLMICKNIYSLI